MKKFIGVERDKGDVYFFYQDIKAIRLSTDRVTSIEVYLESGHSVCISRKEHLQELKEIFMLED